MTRTAAADRPPNAAHVSAVLARKFPRASNSERLGVSGFCVGQPVLTDSDRMVVTVTYHSWE